jgi:2-oxoglutarate dehydrogenase E2 component (dihydrolipoamide succinyltransferase)
MIEIKTPQFPESIADGEIATWHVALGASVKRDEVLVDIETDKVVLEVVAPEDGKLTKILKEAGDTVLAEEVLGEFEPGAVSVSEVTEPAVAAAETSVGDSQALEQMTSPAAKKLAEENNIHLAAIQGSGKGGRITKEDILKAVAVLEQPEPVTPAVTNTPTVQATAPGERIERRVQMTRLRASIAKRLVDAQQTAAMLTTFNEVDMQAIMDLRKQYRDDFEKAHNGTRLGFMSFFVRACIEALKRFPAVNASIDGSDIVYHGYQDIGVAVGSPRGLVVPVIREADSLTLAELEDQVRAYGIKARDGKLSIDDMSGGTFTISNGGVFGSLLSTPILNPPQTAILGMHKIQERPMAIDGEVKIRPMMYLALSYDHRLIDGSEAVRFLVTIKDFLEEPARILLDI